MKPELANEAISAILQTMLVDAKVITESLRLANGDLESGSRNGSIGALGQMDEPLERLGATLSAIRAIHRGVR